MKKTPVNYKNKYDALLKEKNWLDTYCIYSTLVGACFLIATLLLARSGDELTTKVRRYNRHLEDERRESFFYKVLRCGDIGGIVKYHSCYVGKAKLLTLEEIKQAKLHFDLGAKK